MDAGTATLSSTIGSRVRRERRTRGWTLDQLADAAGVSRRMLVNIEQGAANPSIGILLRLSDALGLGLPALVEPPEPTTVKVTLRGDGVVLWSGDHGGSGVLVGGTERPDVVELWDWSLGPGDVHASEAHAPGTMELLQIRAGTVTVVVADESIVLEPGDALTFPADVPHSYANHESEDAQFSLAVFEPRVGEPRRRQGSDD